MLGDRLDIASESPPAAKEPPRPAGQGFLGIQFACCGVYERIYRNREGTAYTGRCPKCARRIQVPIGPGGTAQRFFTAY